MRLCHPPVMGVRKNRAAVLREHPTRERLAFPTEIRMKFVKTILAASLVAMATPSFAADITGAGSTFIFPVLSKWADAYKKDSGSGVNYE